MIFIDHIIMASYMVDPQLTHLPLDKMAAILADDIFICIFLNGNYRIQFQISLKYIPRSPIDNKPALVQVMAWRRIGLYMIQTYADLVSIRTFGNRCLSAIGGGNRWSRFAGWVQLSAEAAWPPRSTASATLCAQATMWLMIMIYHAGN